MLLLAGSRHAAPVLTAVWATGCLYRLLQIHRPQGCGSQLRGGTPLVHLSHGGVWPQGAIGRLFVRIQIGKNLLKWNNNAQHGMSHDFGNGMRQFRRKLGILNEPHLIQKLVNDGVHRDHEINDTLCVSFIYCHVDPRLRRAGELA